MEFWLTGKTTSPCHQEKKRNCWGWWWNKIIACAKNRIFVVQLEHLWEFTSINVKEKKPKNKGEGNFEMIVVRMKVPKQWKKPPFFSDNFHKFINEGEAEPVFSQKHLTHQPFQYKYLEQTPATSHTQECKWVHITPVYRSSSPQHTAYWRCHFVLQSLSCYGRGVMVILYSYNRRGPLGTLQGGCRQTHVAKTWRYGPLRAFKQDQHVKRNLISCRLIMPTSRLQVAQAHLSRVLVWCCK